MAEYSLYIDKNIKKETLNAINKTYQVDAEMTIDVFDDAVVVPGNNGGLYKLCGEMVSDSSILCQRTYPISIDESITTVDEEVVYVGMWGAPWGHCITDNLAHLWFLFDERCQYLKEKKWVYTLIWGDEVPNTFRALLKIYGVDMEDLYRVDKDTRFKKVCFPSACFKYHVDDMYYSYSKEFALFFDKINLPTPKLDLPTYDKIFFSRKQWDKRKERGEQHLEDAFKKMGYAILYPEKMSLEEQIYTIRHCKCLAVTEGSVAHNAIFLERGSKLVVIRKAYYINAYQYPINEMRGLRVFLIDSHKSVCVNRIEPRHGPFFLYCSKNLKSFANGIDLGGFPISEFASYVLNNLAFCVRVILRKNWYKLTSNHI